MVRRLMAGGKRLGGLRGYLGGTPLPDIEGTEVASIGAPTWSVIVEESLYLCHTSRVLSRQPLVEDESNLRRTCRD